MKDKTEPHKDEDNRMLQVYIRNKQREREREREREWVGGGEHKFLLASIHSVFNTYT